MYEYPSEELFNIRSLKASGFSSGLFDLGFSDWFYNSLIASDGRISWTRCYGTFIMKKGREPVTVVECIENAVMKYGTIDVIDLMDELAEKYGCDIGDKWDVLGKIGNSPVYYDKILERLYPNENEYYDDVLGKEAAV